MADSILGKLYEHNNWANRKIIEACAALSDEQLDAQPVSATKGTIRQTLIHLVTAQRNYFNLLTLPAEARNRTPVDFADMMASVNASGDALLALVNGQPPATQLRTADGYLIEPWVVLVQVINHATEHREQICSMLTALGLTPPVLDSWTYGDATGAARLIPA